MLAHKINQSNNIKFCDGLSQDAEELAGFYTKDEEREIQHHWSEEVKLQADSHVLQLKKKNEEEEEY